MVSPDTAFQLLLELPSKSSDPRIQRALQKAAWCRDARIFEPAMQALSQLEKPSKATFDVLKELAIDKYDQAICIAASKALEALSARQSQGSQNT